MHVPIFRCDKKIFFLHSEIWEEVGTKQGLNGNMACWCAAFIADEGRGGTWTGDSARL
jgi:hypothetical protein